MLHYTALFSTLYVIPYSYVAKVPLIGQSRPGSHSGRSFGCIPSPGFLCSISAFCRPTDGGQLLVCEIFIVLPLVTTEFNCCTCMVKRGHLKFNLVNKFESISSLL